MKNCYNDEWHHYSVVIVHPRDGERWLQDAEAAEAKADEAEPEAAAGPSDGGAAATPMETEAQPAASKKKRTRKVPLPVQAEMTSIPEAQVAVRPKPLSRRSSQSDEVQVGEYCFAEGSESRSSDCQH